MRAYAVRLLRLCRIEFSVHTAGIVTTPFQGCSAPLVSQRAAIEGNMLDMMFGALAGASDLLLPPLGRARRRALRTKAKAMFPESSSSTTARKLKRRSRKPRRFRSALQTPVREHPENPGLDAIRSAFFMTFCAKNTSPARFIRAQSAAAQFPLSDCEVIASTGDV
jgi:hypothetical protein